MESISSTPEGPARRAWGVILAWIGGITAVLGFAGTMTGTFKTISEHLHHNGRLDAQITLAQAQEKQGESGRAVETYSEVLKEDPHYRPALDGQLLTAEHWVEDFHVQEQPGERTTVTSGKELDLIFPVLDAALTRAKGTQAADIQAHLGWAHWMNRYLAERETSNVAEDDLRAALAADPTNVYANAMLGNWMVRNNRDFSEGMRHFDTAIATGKERAWVRRLQIGALLNVDESAARTTIVKVANAMRLGNEPLSDDRKHDVLVYCCDASPMFYKELVEVLSVLPRDAFWQTYLWLDSGPMSDANIQGLKRRAIEADLNEIGGERAKALGEWRSLLKDVRGSGTVLDEVAQAGIKRLSK